MKRHQDRTVALLARAALAGALAAGVAACSKKPQAPVTKEVTQPVKPPVVQRGAPSSAAQQGAGGAAPAAAAPSADQLLGQKVKSELGKKGVDVRGIDVVSSRGTVTLFGTVDSRSQRDEAGRAAAEVPGVKSVKNSLAVVSGS